MPKTAVPQMGYFVAVCQDTENNTFAIWEKSESAKCMPKRNLKKPPGSQKGTNHRGV
jgi:hypothetical protein